ncbi:MAG: hypothetical protein HYY40_12850 [Bacteroidetes bacterium]|nr:hypothetical protein [Bacteroidota bacterium]
MKDPPEVGQLTPAQIKAAFDKTGKKWALFIGGGEPLLYPDFIKLVNTLKINHAIQISTNLFNKNVREFAERVTPENIININASVHILHHSSGSLAKFIQNYHLYMDKGFDITVSYVTYPPLFKRMKEDFAYLKSQGIKTIIPLTFQGFFEGKKYPGSYTSDQVKMILENVHEPLELLITLDRMKFYNRMCRAGSGYFFMDYRGDVWRCATIKESCGNLFNGTFSSRPGPAACPVDQCNDACFGIISQVEEPFPPEVEFGAASEVAETIIEDSHLDGT